MRAVARRIAALDGAVAGGVAAALVLAVSLIGMLQLDVMPVKAYGVDAAHTLLAVRLLEAGRALHSDVLTPLGDLAFRPFLWGATLGGTPAGALVWGRLIAGAAVVLLTILVVRRRLSPLSAALVGGAMAATALMPMQFGEPPWALSSAMEYNKVGFALAGLGFCLLVPRRDARGGWVDAALATVLVGLCFHLKITYGLGLAAGLAIGWSAQRRAVLAGYVVLFVIALGATSPVYLASVWMAGVGSYAGAYDPVYPLYLVVSNFGLFALVAAASVAFGLVGGRGRDAGVAATILAASFLIMTQNEQRLLIPSAAVAVVYLHEMLLRAGGRAAPAALAFGALSAVYPAMLVGDWLIGMWHYDAAQRSAGMTTIADGVFAGLRVDQAALLPAATGDPGCEDPASLRNQLAQERELAAAFEAEGMGPAAPAYAYVDHIDVVALTGRAEMGAGRILWRVTARDLPTGPEDAAAIFIPRSSKLREGYLARYGARIAELGFRPGAVGCLGYFVRDARD